MEHERIMCCLYICCEYNMYEKKELATHFKCGMHVV